MRSPNARLCGKCMQLPVTCCRLVMTIMCGGSDESAVIIEVAMSQRAMVLWGGGAVGALDPKGLI